MPRLLALLILVAPALLGAAEKPRNVLLIVGDDVGFQLGCYGDAQARTPNIDRLAAEGTRFTRASCTTSSCSASRSVLLTGLYNHATGHYGHAHGYSHFSTYESVPTLPVMMGEAGYKTCCVGKYHVAPEAVYHFHKYIGGGRNGVKMAADAKTWLKQSGDSPFLLYFCSHDPHRGGGPDGFSNFNNQPDRYKGMERVTFEPSKMTVPSWLPDTPAARKEWAAFYQAINRLDQSVGAILNVLQETGHADDTLVIFLSDNGPPFPGAKTTLYEPGMNLPLIVRDPYAKKSGRVTDARVCWVDIVPTILDWTSVTPQPHVPIRPQANDGKPEKGKKRPVTFHGRSFLAILDEDHPEGFDEIFASHTFHEITMYYPMRVYIDGHYKLIFNIAHQLPYPFASDLYASDTWQDVLKRDLEYYGKRKVEDYLHRPRFELYDLKKDPHEIHNLADDPQFADRLHEMKSRLKAWQEKTNDPWILKWEYE